MKSKPLGFTIVELLVVIVVIAILAAITIVAYNGIQRQAASVVLQSDLHNAGTQLQVDKLEGGQYPTSDGGLKRSNGTTFQYTSDGATFCLTATSDRANVPAYHISSEDLSIREGACDGHAGSGEIIMSAITTTSYSSCAVAGGKAYCWGGDAYVGLLGNGGSNGYSTTPVLVSGLGGKTVTAISGGLNHACAIADGQVYCWGDSSNGKLGNGASSFQNTPAVVGGLLAGKTVTAITAGDTHTCAVANGLIYCWGGNSNGQLGIGNTTSQSTPTAVSTSTGLGGKTITAISADDSHTCAIADGQAYCWGNGGFGRLGTGNTTQQSSPTAVSTSSGLAGKTVTAISAGGFHTCALADGQAYCWGYNNTGQLGVGNTTQQSSPTAVSTSTGLGGKTITAVIGGSDHSCAIANGQVYCWGYNGNGQLGDGSTTQRLSPVAVSGGLAGKTVTQVAPKGTHTCALTGSQVYCWGNNGDGQLGTGNTNQQTSPVLVAPLP